MKTKGFFRILILLVISVMIFTGCSQEEKSDPVQFDTNTNYRIARINIRDYGSVLFRLYSKEEPEAVEKFIELCRSGYYDGKSFFGIIEDYLVIGGEKDALDKNLLKVSGKNDDMYPYRGALCLSFTAEDEVSLSEFYVITLKSEKISDIEELVENKGYTLSDYIKFGYKTELTADELDQYRLYGGAPWLYGHTLVFGQAYEGLDILDQIMTDKLSDDQLEVFIDSIETN